MEDEISDTANHSGHSALPLPLNPQDLMPDLPEPRSYSNLSDIYRDLITNKTFIISFVIGALGFFLLQKCGETVHAQLVGGNRRKKVSKQLLGTYFQSLFHAVGISIVSYLVIFEFVDDPERLVTVDKTDDAYFYVVLYKACTVLSISYFVILTPYELFGIEQSMNFRVTMFVHHIVGIFCQAIVFVANPVFIVVGAMTLQCEASTIFLNMRMFGMIMENKYIYFIGGVGALITYPLTRIAFYVLTIQTTYGLMDTFVSHVGIGAFYLTMFAQVFVFCMSARYTIMLWKDPMKMVFLSSKKKVLNKQQ